MTLDELTIVRDEGRRFAAAAMRDLGAGPRRYPTWTVADLVRHTGEIHRWVARMVAERSDRRLPRPEGPDTAGHRLVDWFRDGVDHLVRTLEVTPPDTAVWSFGDQQTAAFWRRRMALETTIHRWDAQDALGGAEPIDPSVARAGVAEALHVYLRIRLARTEIGGAGTRLRLVSADGPEVWTLTFGDVGVEVADADADGGADAVVRGSAEDLWLFVMGRRAVGDLEVHGDRAVADLCVRAVDLVPGPA